MRQDKAEAVKRPRADGSNAAGSGSGHVSAVARVRKATKAAQINVNMRIWAFSDQTLQPIQGLTFTFHQQHVISKKK